MHLRATAPSRVHLSSARRNAVGTPTPVQAGRQRVVVRYRNWEGLAEAAARRERESFEVKERARRIDSYDDFRRTLEMSGERLVVLEVDSPQVCELTFNDTRAGVKYTAKELEEEARKLAKCQEVKHTFQRVARACPDVEFVELQVDEQDPVAARGLMQSFGVDTLPTIQFWRNGRKLWEHRGAQDLDRDLGEGVLYYSGTAGSGTPKASQYIHELSSPFEYNNFVAGGSHHDRMLTVVNFATEICAPCVHIFPAVVALARSFKDHAQFGRVMCVEGDANTTALMREHNVQDVPTFLFYRGGRLLARHVGASRGDLIAKLMEVQAMDGQPLPAVEGKRRGRGWTKPRM